MQDFIAQENLRLARFKQRRKWFSRAAAKDGYYRHRLRPYCLPRAHAEENLFSEIRAIGVHHFKNHHIKWHDGIGDKPSNHLRDSQVCCVNFLLPFHNRPEALMHLLSPYYPNIQEMLPVEDGLFVSFEWIGAENYLGEKIPRHGLRTRGANFTSADAILKFQRTDGLQQVLLIEWKYTETYGNTDLKIAKSGTDRTSIYRHLYEDEGCPIDKSLLPAYHVLFFEPFYQLMRQQFLAKKMEEAGELNADIVSLLHIAPAHNLHFQRVTSPDLALLGGSPTDIWKKLVTPASRFLSISTEALFGAFLQNPPVSMNPWCEYILARYPWITTA